MKKVLCALLLMTVLLSACTQQEKSATVYFGISDPGMSLEGVSSIAMTIQKVSIHNQGTDAWIDVTTSEMTFDLMQLKSEQVTALLQEINLSEGQYNQVRLDVSKVLVTINGETKEAKLPSNTLKINIDLNVTANEPALLNFDFKAEESLHKTGEGKIIMAPVINVEKYTGVEVEKAGKNIAVKNSKDKKSETVGMDEKGEIGKENRITPQTELIVDESGKITKKPETPIAQGKGDVIVTVKDKANNTGSNNSKEEKPSVKTNTGLNVTSLIVTITNVTIHKTGEESSWITVSSEPKSFELLELQDIEAILGETQLDVGQYTQIRLEVTGATGIINGQEVNITVPSKTLKLNSVLKIEEGKTSLATIDFIVERSLNKAGSKYLLKPVIKLTTRSGVEVKDRVRKGDNEEIEYEAEETVEESEITTE